MTNRKNVITITKDHFEGYNVATWTFIDPEPTPILRVEARHRSLAGARQKAAELQQIFEYPIADKHDIEVDI